MRGNVPASPMFATLILVITPLKHCRKGHVHGSSVGKLLLQVQLLADTVEAFCWILVAPTKSHSGWEEAQVGRLVMLLRHEGAQVMPVELTASVVRSDI